MGAYFVFFRPYLTSDYAPMYKAKNASELYSGLDFVTFLTNGRFAYYPIVYLLYGFAEIGITHLQNAWVMQIIGMLIFASAALVVFRIYEKALGGGTVERIGIWLDICIMIMFINPFMTETYVYGSMDWAIGILFAVLAAKLWLDKRYIGGFILGFVATSYYQSNIFIMVVLCLSVYVVCGIKEEKLKSKFWICVVTCFAGVASCTLNVILQRIAIDIFKPSIVAKKVATEEALNILENVHVYLYHIKLFMITTLGFAPKYFSLIMFIVCTIGIALVLIVQCRASWQDISVWIIYCGCMAAIPFSFRIVGVSGTFGPRSLLSVYFAFAGMMIVTLEIGIKTNLDKRIISSALAVVVASVFVYTELGNADCFIQQAIDQNEVRSIYGEILKYEDETGINVTRIISKSDKEPTRHYREQFLRYTGWVYNHRMLFDEWSQGQYLNCVCETEYQCGNMSETEYTEYFDDKEWDSLLLSEQLRFQDDTLYWAIY